MEISNELKRLLTALRWNGENAFGRVTVYDGDPSLDAFRELLISENRIALIHKGNEDWETEIEGQKFFSRRRLPVDIYVSDRIFGDRQKAMDGSEMNPGACGLVELVIGAVCGQLLPNPHGVICEPFSSGPFVIQDEKKQQPGRAGIVLQVLCTGGWMQGKVSVGPRM